MTAFMAFHAEITLSHSRSHCDDVRKLLISLQTDIAKFAGSLERGGIKSDERLDMTAKSQNQSKVSNTIS